jgi:hypothetical protein
LQTRRDGLPEVREKGIKELLQLVVNGGLDRKGGYCDTVHMDGTRGKEEFGSC